MFAVTYFLVNVCCFIKGEIMQIKYYRGLVNNWPMVSSLCGRSSLWGSSITSTSGSTSTSTSTSTSSSTSIASNNNP